MDSEYEWLASLGGDETFELRRARTRRTGSAVLVKTARAGAARNADALALQRECALASQLSSAATLLPRITSQPGGVALVMEDPGGAGLADLLSVQGRLALAPALDVAIQLTTLLAELHARGVLHNRIRPDAALCDTKRGLAWWVDVGDAVTLEVAAQRKSQPHVELSLRHLVYASPECTGRIDACADARSDLYVFGVLVYEMLTGAPPFRSDDALALIHMQIAGTAAPPARRCADVPEVMSMLVMKLLAKAPEERYQSADGLLHDLQRCSRSLAAHGHIEAFELGRRDVPRQLIVGARLVGREAELQRLLGAFEAACGAPRAGPGELVLVEGIAGVGKTALIEQLYKPIARRRGRFISGKFDQVARGVPFGALIQAFSGWVHQALSENEIELAKWRARLVQALGGNAGVLTEVIPELELILGPQSAPTPLTGTEALNRFQRVMQAFVAALATPEQPLVLFLDDLQWADPATLGLLEPLLAGNGIEGLMLLGACRDADPAAAPLLAQTLEALRASGASVRRIALQPLRPDEFAQLIAESLRSDLAHAQPLAALLFAKTAGNPFFAIQFLESLDRAGQFSFDAERGHWAYRMAAIASAPLADNVIDLMTQRIIRLPSQAQYALTIAACIGNRFDLGTLAVASEQSLQVTARDIERAAAEGLVARVVPAFEAPDEAPETARFAFVHDRVQQSAYALIPEPRRAFVHLTVGRLLLAHTTGPQRDAELFEIAHHLNLGRELIQERAERIEVAALNLAAGQRAKAATAHAGALELFEAGVALLDAQAWTLDPALSFELHFEAAQSRYLCGDFDAAEQRLVELIAHAGNRIESARIARQRSVQLENLGQYAQALATTRDALALFGVTLPDSPAEQERALVAEIETLDDLRGERPIAALVDLPVMADPEVRVVMDMLIGAWSSAFLIGAATLARLFSATLVRLSLQHGNVEESAYGYVTHAITVGPVRGDYAQAYEFGTLALAVNERFADKRLRAKVYQQFHAHVNLWCRPFQTCAVYAQQAYTSGLDAGDFVYAAYALGTEPWGAIVAGPDLAQFVRDHEPGVAAMEKLKNRGFADFMRLMLNWARALQGLTHSPLSLSDASLDEAAYVRDYDSNPFFSAIHSILRLQLCCLLGTPAQAFDAARQAELRVGNVPGTIWPVVQRLWSGLALAAHHVERAPGERVRALQQLRDAQAWFEALARHCEENFRCPALLLQGCAAHCEGRAADALHSFAAAVDLAARFGQPQTQALAHEWCARAHLALGQTQLARLHLGEAARCCGQWGAAAKVQALAEQYPLLLGTEAVSAANARLAADAAAPREASAGAGPTEGLDLASVLKVAQAIASEVKFDALLTRLLHLTIENAAAERGALVLEGTGGALVYHADAADEPAEEAPRGVPLEASDAVPHAIVNYVRRSRQALVLSGEQIGERFAADAYIARHAPRSVLCIPVLQQGASVGVFYLEHRRVTAAFSAQRVRVLQLLAAQAAIALENARLFSGLHEQIAERELAQAQLAGALAEVQRLKDDLEAENTYLRRDLIANVSHDLRTPLVAMRGYLELLKAKGEGLDPDERRSYVDIAVRQSTHLGTLIDELFELAKLDFKGVTINREAFQFADLAFDVLQKFKLAAAERDVALHVDAPGSLPLVNADLGLMERVLDNLIGNALAHTPEKGQVSVRLAREADQVRVQVADTGEGIAQDQLPLIFNRFYRVDKARTGGSGSNGGAGLGLAITKRIVELHDSRIEVHSEPARGTCFSFSVPLNRA